MANKLQSIVDKVSELKKLMQEQGKEALKEAFKEFFAAHPEATAVVWTQYTPYFNDGDACTFSVGELELKVNASSMAEDVQKLLGHSEEDEDDTEYQYGDGCAAGLIEKLDGERCTYYDPCEKAGVEHRKLSATEQSLVSDFHELARAVNSIPEVLEMVLGDHVKVVATAEGFAVEEHDHD